jgi:hypothetical protein
MCTHVCPSHVRVPEFFCFLFCFDVLEYGIWQTKVLALAGPGAK